MEGEEKFKKAVKLVSMIPTSNRYTLLEILLVFQQILSNQHINNVSLGVLMEVFSVFVGSNHSMATQYSMGDARNSIAYLIANAERIAAVTFYF